MAYQALARQYRPQNFTELVGQEHVSQALMNGLEQGRIHHAFLFTGTRGVGKTTVARILAKALNCETGITGNPCGVCGACTEISEGRFVDLVEVDAASRTGVDDTRELLENVQYAPTKGRFKIYLIDEVHMFSNSSFNALLKTLEEPPPHVKFLLATTEPKKLPITVLSRCLQFNLKRLTLTEISNHLAKLLGLQKNEFDKTAIDLIARAADGSMRDGLSLLDQSLAFGAGKVTGEDVKLMLGTMDQDSVVDLLNAIIDKDTQKLNDKLSQIFIMSPDYSRFLSDMLFLLHEISLLQILNNFVDNSAFDRKIVKALAEKTTPEQIQLFYQIVIKGQNEINLAPDSKTGFEMTIIRMFAFKIGSPQNGTKIESAQQTQKSRDTQTQTQQVQSKRSISEKMNAGIPEKNISQQPTTPQTTETKIAEPAPSIIKKYNLADFNESNWQSLFNELELKGTARELARNGHIISNVNSELVLAIDKQAHAFMTEGAQVKLINAIKLICKEDIAIKITQDIEAKKTIAKNEQIKAESHIQETKQKVNENQFVQHMQENFDAQVIQIKQGQNFLEV